MTKKKLLNTVRYCPILLLIGMYVYKLVFASDSVHLAVVEAGTGCSLSQSPLGFGTRPVTEPELTDLSSPDLPISGPQCWGYKHALPLLFNPVVGNPNSGPHICTASAFRIHRARNSLFMRALNHTLKEGN